jgi:hypothetical protein
MGGPGSGRKKGSGGVKKNPDYNKKTISGTRDTRKTVSTMSSKELAKKFYKTHNKGGSLKNKKVKASWSNA